MQRHDDPPRMAAVDTFALYHRRIALVLASTGLSDVERIRLAEALYRIAHACRS